ncbi:carbohydrate binding domain protein [Paraprevotella xylaniphila YIT 11841]|uniref:Carbohydrate binding domain protein n=1 Tax=Paraprevotella xylaniphila YIT 11841 TaxID=762982 RepID=F3QSN1_9BACT|nr:carbohydrate-binding protein [Paraprevotella xylaniphila]EGG55318.1 carbohydrate binding domain protein [Paraprevotella xylaniphila YIT 11841]
MIEIKDNNEVLVLSTPIGVGSKRKFELMKDDYITLKFSLLYPVRFKLGCHTECEFGRFEIIEDQKPSFNNSTGGYDYELKMEASYMKWKNKVFKYTPETGGNEAAWDLTAQLSYHLDIFLRNLKAWGFQFNGEDYEYEIDNDVNVDALVMHYSNTNLIDALTALAEAANCEWWIEGKKIRFGRCENGEAVEIILGEEAETMSLSKSSGEYFTRIYAFGSTQNISSRYRKKLEFTIDTLDRSGNKSDFKDSNKPVNPSFFRKDLIKHHSYEKQMDGVGTVSASLATPDIKEYELYDNLTINVMQLYKSRYVIDLSSMVFSYDFSSFPNAVLEVKVEIVASENDASTVLSESSYTVDNSNKTLKLSKESFESPYGLIRKLYLRITYSCTSPLVTYIPYTLVGDCILSSVYGYVETDVHYVDEDGENHKIGVTINRNAMPYTDEHATLLYEITSNDKLYIGAKFTIDGLVKGNVPLGYFDSDVDGLTVNGVVQRRLMLPEGTPYIDVYPDMSPDEVIEGIVTFDYVYPRKVLSISSVEEEMIDVTEGEEKKPTGMKVPVYTIKTTGLVGFDNSYVISEKLTITLQTGKLAGLTFGLTFLPEKSDNTSTCFEIVANEDYGGRLPDTVMKPEAGNEFVMAGYDTEYVFENLVTEAEEELKSEAEKYAEKIRNNIGTVSAKLMSDWSKARNEAQETPCPFDVGQKVTVNNPSFFPSPRTMRVLGYELALDIPWDSPVYTIGESASYSRLGALEDKIDSIKLNGSRYFSGKVSSSTSGTNVYLIKKDDETEPSDTNAYSSLRTDKEIKEGIEKNNKELAKKFLSKLNDDTASGIITFLQGLIIGNFSSGESGGQISSDGAAELASLLLRGALEIGKYSAGKSGAKIGADGAAELLNVLVRELVTANGIQSPGFSTGALGTGLCLKMDGNGDSYIEVDRMLVRKVAEFIKLVIQEIKHVGGQIILTPASMSCVNVEDKGDYYRCHFTATDGEKTVENQFVVGDFARAQTFNVKEGVNENVKNTYYWRLVTGVGDDYIDLSKTDCDAGSTVPAAGDEIVQLGNRNDAARQAAIILAAYGNDAPYIKMYRGINSYKLDGKEFASFSRKEVNIIADVFKWSSGESVKDYIDGSVGEVQDKVDEVSGKVEDAVERLAEQQNYIAALQQTSEDLQDQIDGAIESYFEKTDPTTSNYPANEWTTEEQKQSHSNDTYTNISTGKSWKWVKDGSTWKWKAIADTATEKALAAAAKAQDTADGKRRVFVSQPTTGQAYDVGDLWVNATYGETYKNDLLRCKTSKKENEAFSISHWELASRYTDDTKANEAKTAADNAAKAAKNAQADANEANSMLSDIANDNKLTAQEKQQAKKEWDVIVSEKPKNDASADKFGVSKTAYGSAYTALSTYVTPLLSDLSSTSNITGTEFRAKFKAYYDARTDLLNAISAKAKELADNAQEAADAAAENASQAIEDAASAKNAADKAQADVDAEKERMDDWAADGKFSPSEKKQLKEELARIDGDKTQVADGYTKYGLGTPTAYNTAYTNYRKAINGVVSSSSETVAIPSDFATKRTAYYTQKSAALTAISDAAKAYADKVVAGIEVGGRNILMETNQGKKRWYANTNEGETLFTISEWVDEGVKGVKLELTKKPSSWSIIYYNLNGTLDLLEPNTTYMLSFDVLSNISNTLSATIMGSNATGKLTNSPSFSFEANKRKHVVLKLVTNDLSEKGSQVLYFSYNKVSYICFKNLKLEKGNVATAWTPAIEDVNGMIEDAQKAADDAAEAAKKAQTDATNANKELTNIKSDNLISPIEKTALKQQQADIRSEYGEITANAVRYSVSTTAYKAAYDKASAALTKYTASSPEYITVGSDYANISAYYDARKTILDAIAAAAKKAADDATNKANQAVEDAARAGHYLLDLDNDSGQVACDADGNVTGGYPTTNAKVWYGTEVDTGWTFKGTFSGCTGSVGASSGAVTVTGMSKDDASVTVTATKSGKPELSAVFTVVKVRSGRDGTDGTNGVGIKSITNKYAVSASNTTAPTSWSDTVPTMTTTNRYLWNYEIVTYTNGTTSETKKRVIGAYGNTGNTGATGATGVGIKSITEYYLASSASSGVTTSTSGWTTSVQTTSSSKKYLWNYEVVTYTNDTKYTSSPVIIGTYGDKGDTGPQGVQGPKGADGTPRYTWIRYADNASGSGISNSPTGKTYIGFAYNKTTATESNTPSDYTWSLIKGEKGDTGVPGAKGADGKTTYTWIKYSDNSTGSGMYDTPKSTTQYIGIAVNKTTATESNTPSDYTWSKFKGDDGADGKGIKSTAVTYQASTSGTTPPTGTWSASVPSVAANQYLWTRTVITYTDNATSTSYSVGKMGANGAKGDKGDTGPAGADGDGIVSVSNTYQVGSSGTTAPTGSWSATVPSPQKGKYLWTKTVTTYKKSDPTTVYSVSYYGTDGTAAKYVRVAGDQVFVYANNFSGNPTPTSITLTATLTGTSGYQWSYKQAGQSSFTNISGATSQTYALAHNNSTVWGSAKSVTIRCTSGGVYDEITIAKVSSGTNGTNGKDGTNGTNGKDGAAGKNGTDAYTIILGNESHAFQGTTSAAIAASTKCEVIAYKGATRVAATIGTITGAPSGMSTSISSNGTTSASFTVSVTSSLTTGQGVLTVPITVDGKTFTKNFSFSVAFKGNTGATGAAGKGVKSIVEQYYLSTSNTAQSGGSWVTAPPAWANGKYMWTRSVITYTDNSSTTTSPVCVTGAKGATGDKGATGATGAAGKGVSSVDVLYYLSTSATSLSGGSWSTTAPAWVNGKYMWSKTKVTYTDGSSKETNPVCITGAKGDTGATGAKGDKGQQGNPGADAVFYTIEPSVAIVKKSWDNKLTPTSVTCTKYKQTGSDARATTTEKTLKYQRVGTDGSVQTAANGSSVTVSPTSTTTSIKFWLYDGSNIIMMQEVPIVGDAVDVYEKVHAEIEQKEDSILSTVQKTYSTKDELTGLETTLGKKVSTVEQTAESLKTTVSGLNGKVSTLEQTDSSLKSQISTANGKISTLEQTTSKISLKVSSIWPDNLFPDGSFEYGGLSNQNLSNCTVSIDGSSHIHGSKSLKIQCKTGNSWVYLGRAQVPVVAGKLYTIVMWIRATSSFTESGGATGAYFSTNNQLELAGFTAFQPAFTSAWTRKTYKVTAPSGSKFLVLRLGTAGQTTNRTLYFDGIMVFEGDLTGDPPTSFIEGKRDGELATGIDVVNKKITVTGDQFVIRNNAGDVTASVDADGVLKIGSGEFSGYMKTVPQIDPNNNSVTVTRDVLKKGGFFCFPTRDGSSRGTVTLPTSGDYLGTHLYIYSGSSVQTSGAKISYNGVENYTSLVVSTSCTYVELVAVPNSVDAARWHAYQTGQSSTLPDIVWLLLVPGGAKYTSSNNVLTISRA